MSQKYSVTIVDPELTEYCENLLDHGRYLVMMLTPLKGEWIKYGVRCRTCWQIHAYAAGPIQPDYRSVTTSL